MTSLRKPITKQMMKWIASGLVIAAVIAGCERKEPVAPPLTVTVAQARSEDVVVTRTWVGLLNGNLNADVRAQVTGYLLTQNYKEGTFVKTGDVLFTIDARPFEAALSQAQADYAQKVAQAQLAQITLDRQAQLFQTKVISQQEYDTAAANAQATTAAAAAAQATVQAAQVNLNYCAIHAPFEGVVGKAQAQIGDLVGPGGSATVLTQISQLDPIKAQFFITENEYLWAADMLNQPAEEADREPQLTIQLADGRMYPEKGSFDFVNRQINSATGSIEVNALFPNKDNILRPGLFVRVTAPVQKLEGALVVPQQAVAELQGSHFVAVVGAENKIETIPVETGPTQGPDIVVRGQLQAGDKVVIGGIEKVRPGMIVIPKPFQPGANPTPPKEATPAPPDGRAAPSDNPPS